MTANTKITDLGIRVPEKICLICKSNVDINDNYAAPEKLWCESCGQYVNWVYIVETTSGCVRYQTKEEIDAKTPNLEDKLGIKIIPFRSPLE